MSPKKWLTNVSKKQCQLIILYFWLPIQTYHKNKVIGICFSNVKDFGPFFSLRIFYIGQNHIF
jgi:hypothetical protein